MNSQKTGQQAFTFNNVFLTCNILSTARVLLSVLKKYCRFQLTWRMTCSSLCLHTRSCTQLRLST